MGKITGGFLTTFVSCVTICMSAAAQEDSLKVEERRDSITEARITAEKYAEEASGSRTGHSRLEKTDSIPMIIRAIARRALHELGKRRHGLLIFSLLI